MRQIILLLAGCAAGALAMSAADAQSAPTQLAAADAAPAAPAPDDTAPADGTDASQATEITVIGFGRARQVQSVTNADIQRLTPGSSPLKAIEKLPGVNFQAADPFGAYEWAVRISLRGFNQNQLGFTLDGIPLGDMSYGNVNGLHISRAIISENVGRAEVAQGAGALETASTSNLGGTIQFYSDAPKSVFDYAVSGTYGSDSTERGYARIDTGDLGHGMTAYLSYTFLHADKWKGDGPQRQNQVNAKISQDLGIGTLSGFFDFSARRETDYQDLTLDLFNRIGKDRAYKVDNISNDYKLAEEIATDYQTGKPYPAPYANPDDVYYDAGGLRNDYLGGINLDAQLTSNLSVKGVAYYHHNKGQGTWFTPYVATPVGAPDDQGKPILDPSPLSYRTTEYGIDRGGVTGSATYEMGVNSIQVGGWYEDNRFDQARRYYGLSEGDQPDRATLQFQNDPFLTQYQGAFKTSTVQYFVEDTLKLMNDKLVLNGGWKGVHVVNTADVSTGPLASGRIDAKDWFQPQVSAVFHVTPATELFADYSENMRAFVSALTTGPFSTTQAGFDAIRGSLKPERSRTVEGGVRLHEGPFNASAVAYYVDFTNRLAAFANGSGIAGNPAILNNVGSVHDYGGELTASYRIAGPLSVFANYSYNHNTYQNDVFNNDGTVYAYTKGKTVVDSPKHMLKGEIVYDDGGFSARATGDWMSKRYFSYEDDLVAAGRFLLDAEIGYRFKGEGVLNGWAIVGNVTNLTNKKYISTVDDNNVQVRGYTNTPNSGVVNGAGFDADNPNFMVGPHRQWFVTLKKAL